MWFVRSFRDGDVCSVEDGVLYGACLCIDVSVMPVIVIIGEICGINVLFESVPVCPVV